MPHPDPQISFRVGDLVKLSDQWLSISKLAFGRFFLCYKKKFRLAAWAIPVLNLPLEIISFSRDRAKVGKCQFSYTRILFAQERKVDFDGMSFYP